MPGIRGADKQLLTVGTKPPQDAQSQNLAISSASALAYPIAAHQVDVVRGL